jgi:dihydrofolate reductase
MAKLIHSAITSLDGYVADEDGNLAERDITVGGPELAGQAIRAGLVDESHLFVSPIVVGAGKPSLPDQVRVALEMLDSRRFGNGVVYLRYRI